MRFNTATKVTTTLNLAGGQAFQEDPRLEFVSILLTSFVQDQFYRKADDTLARLIELMQNIDKSFAAKAAIYARQKYGMRSISHVVAGEIAKTVKGETWTKNFFRKVVHRPDDMLEILAYYKAGDPKRAEPNALKKGFAAVLRELDEYQLAKYRAEGKEINLYDLVNLCHPKATPALNKLMRGELKAADTWETKLTQAGQQAEDEEDKTERKAEAWKGLIESRKIGYFALLRNLRNVLEQAPEMVEAACEMLQDERLIRKSLVLPFRFSTALEEIEKVNFEGVRTVMVALNSALDKSVANVPKLDGRNLIALDCSGSMTGKPAQIGSLFAAVLVKANDVDLLLFNDRAWYKTINPMDSTLTIASTLRVAEGGTNFHIIFKTANKAYDRIIILSDMQAWIGGYAPTAAFQEYKRRLSAKPVVYSFDLAGYGTLQFPEKDVYCLAGFSEKVFDIMKLLEQDKHALIRDIERIEL